MIFAKLESANVFVYNGAGMEMWVDDVLKSLSNKKLVAVETSKRLELLENHDDDDDHDHDHDGKKEDNHDHDGKKDNDNKDEHKEDAHKTEDKDHDDKDKDHDHDEHHHHHGKYDPHVWLSIKNS